MTEPKKDNISLLPSRSILHYQRPQRMDDPLRPIWYRIHHDHQYEPSNIEARFLGERIKEIENERNRMEGALRFIQQSAEAWHGDSAAKDRALAVIETVAKNAITHV